MRRIGRRCSRCRVWSVRNDVFHRKYRHPERRRLPHRGRHPEAKPKDLVAHAGACHRRPTRQSSGPKRLGRRDPSTSLRCAFGPTPSRNGKGNRRSARDDGDGLFRSGHWRLNQRLIPSCRAASASPRRMRSSPESNSAEKLYPGCITCSAMNACMLGNSSIGRA